MAGREMLGAEWTQLGGYGDGTVKVWFTAGMQQQGPRLASDAGSTASAAFGPAAGASWWSTTARRFVWPTSRRGGGVPALWPDANLTRAEWEQFVGGPPYTQMCP
ncbi:MAG: hypothetical protein JO286_02510 [Solirubrobacterales bacterium]|nr:hypothetical protein [Solirubrobacterales bacterium]